MVSYFLFSLIFCYCSGYQYTIDKWLKTPYSSYEYVTRQKATGTITFDTAKDRCKDYGGELAYAGLFHEASYE